MALPPELERVKVRLIERKSKNKQTRREGALLSELLTRHVTN